MKNIFFTLISAAIVVSQAQGQTNETVQEISVPVQSAIVYLYGAEMAHSKQITLNAGRNKIVFLGLSSKLNSKSIQVSTSGDASILAISDAINYMANQKESSKIKQLKDSVVLLNDALGQINIDKDAFAGILNSPQHRNPCRQCRRPRPGRPLYCAEIFNFQQRIQMPRGIRAVQMVNRIFQPVTV